MTNPDYQPTTFQLNDHTWQVVGQLTPEHLQSRNTTHQQLVEVLQKEFPKLQFLVVVQVDPENPQVHQEHIAVSEVVSLHELMTFQQVIDHAILQSQN